MKPIDHRNENWDHVMARMEGLRLDVYRALERLDPCTTRELARLMNEDVLNVRPRVTELCDLGLAELADDLKGREGVYQAIPYAAALARFDRLKSAAAQLSLGL